MPSTHLNGNAKKANGVGKKNGFANGNFNGAQTISLPPSVIALEMGPFTPPIQIKKPPFAFRILNQINSFMGRKNEHFDLTYTSACDTSAVDPMRFQQSVTRNLAFPSTSSFTTVKDEKNPKHLSEFYSNSTLSLIAKIFSICVILCALCMMIRELFFYGRGR